MRIQRSAAAAAVFAAVLLAGACSSSTKSTNAGAPAPSTPAAAPATVTITSAPATSSGSAAGGSSSSAAPSTAGSSSAQGGAASSTACKGADLKVRIVHGTDADPDPAKTNEAATVAITNSGQSTCTVQGHPQVDLISAAGDDWPLVPQAGDTPKLTLPPGTSAFASLYVLSHSAGGGGEAFQVKSAVITPPDTKTPTTVPWPWTWALERQDTATHPGTFIGAVNSTGT
jgi:hypothetical protein